MLRIPRFPSATHNESEGSRKTAFNRSHQERTLDEALMESFPASDPVAVNFSYVVCSTASWPLKRAQWTWHEVAFGRRLDD